MLKLIHSSFHSESKILQKVANCGKGAFADYWIGSYS